MIDLKCRSDGDGQLQLIERDDMKHEEDLFKLINELIAQGINAGDIKKLQDAGIYTCDGLMMHTKKNLTGIEGLSETKVDKLCEAAEKVVNLGHMTGSDASLKKKQVTKITSGSSALDELLGGGIETSCITEAFGEVRSGKTQLAHTLCVSAQLPINMLGGNGKVAYIDAEGTSRPDRIIPVAERFRMDSGVVLDTPLRLFGGGNGRGKRRTAPKGDRKEPIRREVQAVLNEPKTVAEVFKIAFENRLVSWRKLSETGQLLSVLSNRHRNLKEELDKARNTENFDKAHKLNGSMIALEQRMDSIFTELRSAELECEVDDLKMQTVNKQIAAAKQCAQGFELKAKESFNNADVVMNDAEESFSKEMSECESKEDDLFMSLLETQFVSDCWTGRSAELAAINEEIIKDEKEEKIKLLEKIDFTKRALEGLYGKLKIVDEKICGKTSMITQHQLLAFGKLRECRSVERNLDSKTTEIFARKKSIAEISSQQKETVSALQMEAQGFTENAATYEELVAEGRCMSKPFYFARQDFVRLKELSKERSNIKQMVTLIAKKNAAAAKDEFTTAEKLRIQLKCLETEMKMEIKDATPELLHRIEEEIGETSRRIKGWEDYITEKSTGTCELMQLSLN